MVPGAGGVLTTAGRKAAEPLPVQEAPSPPQHKIQTATPDMVGKGGKENLYIYGT